MNTSSLINVTKLALFLVMSRSAECLSFVRAGKSNVIGRFPCQLTFTVKSKSGRMHTGAHNIGPEI
jgi:hypothetical protein